MTDSAPDPATPTASTDTTSTSTAADHGPTPLLAVLGAGEAAVAAIARAFADARTRAAARRETVAHRFGDLPTEFEELRTRFSAEELRHAFETYREQVNRAYAEFAARGEQTWDRLREQPQVRTALSAVESYSGKLDTRVHGLVEEAHDAAGKARSVVSRQTRATGEMVARAGQRFSGRAADTVVDVTAGASATVEDAGTATASAIEDAGDGTAAATRSVTRKAADTTAPAPDAD
jgi:heparin binding hemagglutinin HbhA